MQMALELTPAARVLSSHALQALAEFNAEREAQAKELERLMSQAAVKDAQEAPISIESFAEDWEESQFWVNPSQTHTS
jgi:pyrroloquinoline quinone (PQQ) biosynthesis protein C